MQPSDCAPNVNTCLLPTCASCACGTSNAPAGTTCTFGGGTKCDGNGNCIQCTTSADCTNLATPICISGVCSAATCSDKIQDGTETDKDCGGASCPPCPVGDKCKVASDCTTMACDPTTHQCVTPPVNDQCSTATAFTLTPGGAAVTLQGTTTDSTSYYTTHCAPSPAPSVVYAITLTAGGTFTASVTANNGSTLLPIIDLRQVCTNDADACVSYGTSTANVAEDADVLAGSVGATMTPGTYYLIVTGSGLTSGAFTLKAQLQPAVCGDGILNTGEQCDPGAAVANDGCGAPGGANPCQLVAAPAGQDQCPGQAVATIMPGTTTVLSEAMGMSTWGFKDDYVGSCLAAGGGATGGVDRVFQLTPSKTGTMTVKVGYQTDGTTSICGNNLFDPACWAPMIYARTTCATASTEVACATGPSSFPFVPETISFPVTASVPVWVFVDGWDGLYFSSGPFNLVIDLQ